MTNRPNASIGTAADVPYVVVPPASQSSSAPVVVSWHLMDPPRSEAAFAAAMPLEGVSAWRIYLGLPMHGTRLPPDGAAGLTRLAYEDAVMNLQGPIANQAAEEFPAAFAVLRERLGFDDRAPVGLVGGSLGAAVAQLVLLEQARGAGLTVGAVVLVSPITRLQAAVDATGRRFGVTYPWRDAPMAVARRLDFVERAAEFVAAGQPAVCLIVGADDDRDGFVLPAEQLLDELRRRYRDPTRSDLVVIEGMTHAFAEEPGDEPAPQTPRGKDVDRAATTWLRAHLIGAAGDSDGAP
jgi:pimeloyl-ACP methyl ester carboxylesterase